MDRAIDLVVGRSFYYAALRHCDKHDLGPESLPQIEGALRHRALMDAIQPLLRQQANVLALAVPKIIVHSDGRVETLGDGLSDDQRATIAILNDLVIWVAQQLGLHYSPLPRE